MFWAPVVHRRAAVIAGSTWLILFVVWLALQAGTSTRSSRGVAGLAFIASIVAGPIVGNAWWRSGVCHTAA